MFSITAMNFVRKNCLTWQGTMNCSSLKTSKLTFGWLVGYISASKNNVQIVVPLKFCIGIVNKPYGTHQVTAGGFPVPLFARLPASQYASGKSCHRQSTHGVFLNFSLYKQVLSRFPSSKMLLHVFPHKAVPISIH
jgi:hypothetical protein